MHRLAPFNNKKYSVFILLLVSFCTSCDDWQKKINTPTAFSLFSDKLKVDLKPIDTTNKKNQKSVAADVRRVYQGRDYMPVWLKENYSPSEASEKLFAELEDMQWDGINPDRYNLSALKLLKQKLDTTKHNTLADAIAFDTALTHSYLAAAKDLLFGEISPKKADSLWFHVNDTVWNAPQLLATKGSYTSLADFRSEVPAYLLLRSEYRRYAALAKDTDLTNAIAAMRYVKHPDSELAEQIITVIKAEIPWVQTTANDTMSQETQYIVAYQNYSGIRTTGKLDSITFVALATPPEVYLKKLNANMERIRWMQRQFGDIYLIVDVPQMELFLRKDGANVQHMRVVVGKPERQTPSLYATMANIVINPSWGVPPTILKKDVLPGLRKSGRKYMRKKGLKVYDNDGNVVDPSFINENNYKRYTYKQAPGDDNSLGYVKFNLPNPWDIYLHDTPHRDDFGKRDRFLSSGCIRLQYPKEMAIYILSDMEKKKNYTPGRLDSMIATHKTRWEILRTKIPVHIAYLTAYADTTGKHVQFMRDIYFRDDKLISLLN